MSTIKIVVGAVVKLTKKSFGIALDAPKELSKAGINIINQNVSAFVEQRLLPIYGHSAGQQFAINIKYTEKRLSRIIEMELIKHD